jgi:hypothetical protein
MAISSAQLLAHRLRLGEALADPRRFHAAAGVPIAERRQRLREARDTVEMLMSAPHLHPSSPVELDLSAI